jgi:hypothetical protein
METFVADIGHHRSDNYNKNETSWVYAIKVPMEEVSIQVVKEV